jgi:sugar lactone lactonase YvrE
MMTRRFTLAIGTVLVASACGGSEPPPAPPPAPPPPPAPTEAPVAVAPPPAPEATAPEAPKEPPKPAAPTPIWRVTEGVNTPESVLYDEAADRYLVSNINGKADEADNNGYIMEISPDGKVTNPKLVAGGEKKVKLDAPKGSGIADGIFYVTDIKVVRKFDVKTWAPKGDIPMAGATFLNDIAVGPGGKVYVSDTGVKGKDGGFAPTGTDAVYVLDKGKVKPVAKSKDLSGPNGLLWTEKGVLVVTFGSNELYRLDDKGVKQDVTKLPAGGLDGLAAWGDSLLVTSWQAAAIFKGKLNGKFEVAIPDVKGSADIGVDTKRNRLIVPRFLDNAVEAYELK